MRRKVDPGVRPGPVWRRIRRRIIILEGQGDRLHVISKSRLRDFWSVYPEAESPLMTWYREAKEADRANFADIRRPFNSADRVGRFTVFNIGGNKFRLVADIHFERGKIFIHGVMTHREHDRGRWKDDCHARQPAMATQAEPSSPADVPYMTLIRQFPLRPIKSEADLRLAIAAIDALLAREGRTQGEEDYLDVLSDLVEKYEDENVAMPKVSDAELLRNMIENRDLAPASVSAGTGMDGSTLDEILSGRRSLHREEIEVLSGFFGVSPLVFFPS